MAVAPAAGDLPQSLIKLLYNTARRSRGRKNSRQSHGFNLSRITCETEWGRHFQDYDLGSAGPLPLPGMNLVIGLGKMGVLYVLDADTAKFGKGPTTQNLSSQPFFHLLSKDSELMPSRVANLDRLFDGKTHHLHSSPAFWVSPARGPMLFNGGENEIFAPGQSMPRGK